MFTEGLSGEVFNLGNPDEYSILEVANKIKSLVGSKSEVVFSNLPEDDPIRRRPDISKVRERVGWEPKVDFEEGLNETLEYLKK